MTIIICFDDQIAQVRPLRVSSFYFLSFCCVSWDISYFWPNQISWTFLVLYLNLAIFSRSPGFFRGGRVFINHDVGFYCSHYWWCATLLGSVELGYMDRYEHFDIFILSLCIWKLDFILLLLIPIQIHIVQFTLSPNHNLKFL